MSPESKLPLGSLEATKSVSKLLTFYKRGGKQKVRRYNKPSGLPSAEQRTQREVIKSRVESWQALSPESKEEWNLAAAAMAAPLSGYNLYIRSPIMSFLTLSDTPSSYAGKAGKLIQVKQDLTGLEFSLVEGIVTIKVSTYLGTNQENITKDTNTKVLLDTENFDTGSDFDIVNSKFVARRNGYYFITGQVRWKDPIQDKHTYGYIAKNGITLGDAVATSVIFYAGSFASAHTHNMSQLVYLLKDDEIFLCCRHNGGVNTPDIMAGKGLTFLSVMEIL